MRYTRTSAAALLAAVDITKLIRDTSPHRRNHLRRNKPVKRQPLFGRGGQGERRFSQRSGLSPLNLAHFCLARPQRLC